MANAATQTFEVATNGCANNVMVDVRRNESLRMYGTLLGHQFDVTVKCGEAARFLIPLGDAECEVVSITNKLVTVKPVNGDTLRRVRLLDFIWANNKRNG